MVGLPRIRKFSRKLESLKVENYIIGLCEVTPAVLHVHVITLLAFYLYRYITLIIFLVPVVLGIENILTCFDFISYINLFL